MSKQSKWRFEYVWPDEYLMESEIALVLTVGIRKKQDIPTVLRLVNAAFPLPQLKHLKRIRRPPAEPTENTESGSVAEIILNWASLKHREGDVLSIRDILPKTDALLPFLTESVRVRGVSSTRPLSKRQLTASQTLWSTSNTNPVICQDTHCFEPSHHELHSGGMNELTEQCTDVASVQSCGVNQLIIKNPSKNTTVFSSKNPSANIGSCLDNPLNHPVMVAISQIATGQLVTAGKRSASEAELSQAEDSSYLCTGFVVYLLREPCVMCSMALVHARIGCVIFLQDAPEDGALKSVFKLQGVGSLNHHFEVWKAHPLLPCPCPSPCPCASPSLCPSPFSV